MVEKFFRTHTDPCQAVHAQGGNPSHSVKQVVKFFCLYPEFWAKLKFSSKFIQSLQAPELTRSPAPRHQPQVPWGPPHLLLIQEALES